MARQTPTSEPSPPWELSLSPNSRFGHDKMQARKGPQSHGLLSNGITVKCTKHPTISGVSWVEEQRQPEMVQKKRSTTVFHLS